ncbi:hypothetical protein RRF57_000800 [Xylaria bambusicola]|uniref:Uncharacterized protein n=1 Tax=Xylaria bambusicola TaxID=326684 RepID=A0AAN7UPA9_9PEZI
MHEAWANSTTHFEKTRKVMNRIKLLLNQNEETREIRKTLKSTPDYLILSDIVESEVEAIADYLAYLLRHVKSQLQSLQLYDDYQIEMVLYVPAIWTQKACRDMQVALFTAIGPAQFKGIDRSCGAIKNLLLVSEQEAAVAFTLDTYLDTIVGTPVSGYETVIYILIVHRLERPLSYFDAGTSYFLLEHTLC